MLDEIHGASQQTELPVRNPLNEVWDGTRLLHHGTARALHIPRIQSYLDLGLSGEEVARRCGISRRRAEALRRYYGFDRKERGDTRPPGHGPSLSAGDLKARAAAYLDRLALRSRDHRGPSGRH